MLSTIVEDSNLVPKDITYADGTTCTTPQREECVAVVPQQGSDSLIDIRLESKTQN